MAFNANNQKELYASVYGCNRGSIYKTKNFDKKRKLIKVLGDRINDIAIDPNNPNTIYALDGETIFKSKNDGKKQQKKYILISNFKEK